MTLKLVPQMPPASRPKIPAGRLFAATALVMCAFAANSILNRAALSDDLISAGAFAMLRVVAGATMLLLLLSRRRTPDHQEPDDLEPDDLEPDSWSPDFWAIVGLSAYMVGFSFAYTRMDAGIGALILFGGVQLTMFSGAIQRGEHIASRRWTGAIISLSGLGLLLWPSSSTTGMPDLSLSAFFLMSFAALGWGIYSLIGQRADDPLRATAQNFTYAVPVIIAACLILGDAFQITGKGAVLAIISGAGTSALGYAAWYAILPMLGSTRAALVQLSVPVIAMAFGALLLGEAITGKSILAASLVLGGILIGMAASKSRR
ncbi:DMT family transporter [Alphaproteobacteria bacterium]|nr:DMT family transporter [Alphaproteobacteria bacterium]